MVASGISGESPESLSIRLARQASKPPAEKAQAQGEHNEWMSSTLSSLKQECNDRMHEKLTKEGWHQDGVKQPSALAGATRVGGGSKEAVSFASCIDDCSPKHQPSHGQGGDGLVIRRRGCQRKGSKSSWRQTMTRTVSLFSPEEMESPEFMWQKYLRFFNHEQLNWISEQFEEADRDKQDKILVADAIAIATTHAQDTYILSGDPQITEEQAEEIVAQFTSRSGRHLAFDYCVAFIAGAEKKILEDDDRAGYSQEEAAGIKDAFDLFARSSEKTGRPALSTVQTFEVLIQLGRETSTVEQQQSVVDIIKVVDIDRSGDIDIREFIQLFRKVQMWDMVNIRRNEHLIFRNSVFSDSEVNSFQELYNYYTTAEGMFTITEIKELLANLGIRLDREKEVELVDIVQNALKGQGADVENVKVINNHLAFPTFLLLLRILMDMDFAGMEQASRHIVQGLESEQKYVSPEEWERKRRKSLEYQLEANPGQAGPTSWVRRMIDKKTKSLNTLEMKKSLKTMPTRTQDGVETYDCRLGVQDD